MPVPAPQRLNENSVTAADEEHARVSASLRWSAVGSLGVRLVSAGRGLLIARLVGPHAMGLFAAVFAFTVVANMLAELGLQTYLVSRGRSAGEHAREVLELALGAGILGAVALIALARPISNLYGEGHARGVAVAMSALVVMTALAVVPNGLLRVEMRFKALARAQVAGELAALLVGVGLALMGAGVWALVGGALANETTTVILLWGARPRWSRSRSTKSSRRVALRFGGTVAVGSIIWSIALQGDNVAVGKLAGAAALGLYAFAYNYGVLPGVSVGSIISDVALASFVNAASSDARSALFLRFSRLTAVVSAPLIATSIAFAPQAIQVFLGDKWLQAASPLRVMLLLGFVRGLLPAELLLRAVGRVNVEVKAGVVAAPLTVVAAIGLAHHGITAVAIGVVVIQSCAAAYTTAIALRELHLAPASVVSAVAFPTIIASALAALLSCIGAVAHLAAPPRLGLTVISLAGYVCVVRMASAARWAELREVVLARTTVPTDHAW